MGDPRKPKKQYEKPKMLWEKSRIIEEKGLTNEYGLKNMKELWKAHSGLRQIRRQARGFLVLGEDAESHASDLMHRLQRIGITKEDATINDVLSLDVKNILDRRLQSIIYKKGLSMSIKQARQLITHGFIKINGNIVKSPGYVVSINDEKTIEYTKPIDINAGINKKEEVEVKNAKESVVIK